MVMINKGWFSLVLFPMIFVTPLSGQGSADTSAPDVIRQARIALHGQAPVQAIQSISASGSSLAKFGEQEFTSELKIELLLPDKYMKTATFFPAPMMQMKRIEVVNAGEAWVKMPPAARPSPGGMDFPGSRPGGGGGGGGMGGQGQGGETGGPAAGGGGGWGGGGGRSGGGRPPGGGMDPARMEAALNSPEALRQVRNDFLVLLLGCVLADRPGFEFEQVSEMIWADRPADVVNVVAPGGLALQLILDRENHRPLALRYKAPMPAGMPMGGPGAGGRQQTATPPQNRELEVTVLVSDYKAVKTKGIGDVLLPHLFQKSVNGRAVEELTVSKYRLNSGPKADKFEKK